MPLGLNEMLDRLSAATRAPAAFFLLASGRYFQACLTLELTGRAHNETGIQSPRMKDQLTRAPVQCVVRPPLGNGMTRQQIPSARLMSLQSGAPNARINPRRASSTQPAIYHTTMKEKLSRRRVE
jgi:hypothetical protein